MMKIPTILHNLFPSRCNNSSSSVIVDGPSDNDVLCGRDRNFAKHPGNFLYRIQVERQASAYALATTKQAKMKITKAIVHTMQTQYGSRFLRRTETNQWEVLTNVQARDKTSHALRFINNSNSSNSSNRTDDSSCDQIVPRDIVNESNPSNFNHVSSTKTNDVLLPKNSNALQHGVVAPLTGGSMSHNGGPDEATMRAIHLRQQELLRTSFQNDNAMDVQGATNMTIDQLMQSPLFSLSGIHPTNQNSMMMIESTRSMDNLGISDMQIMQYIEDRQYQQQQQQIHPPSQQQQQQHQIHQYYTEDDVQQQQFDSIRTRDMMDILDRPIDDTLRSEELNFLLEGSPMDDF